jgi:hypothetical protein
MLLVFASPTKKIDIHFALPKDEEQADPEDKNTVRKSLYFNIVYSHTKKLITIHFLSNIDNGNLKLKKKQTSFLQSTLYISITSHPIDPTCRAPSTSLFAT